MTETTPEMLEELERLLAEATPGPWWIDWESTKETMISGAPGNVALIVKGEPGAHGRPDARLIVAAVRTLPALLRDLAAAREEVEALSGERDNAIARAAESDAWRHVAAYYLGDYTRTHTPDESRAEAMRRAVAEGAEHWREVERAREAWDIVERLVRAVGDWSHRCPECGAPVCSHVVLMARRAAPAPEAEADRLTQRWTAHINHMKRAVLAYAKRLPYPYAGELLAAWDRAASAPESEWNPGGEGKEG